MVAPFVSEATATRIGGLKRRAFATKLALADPPFTLVLDRYNAATDGWETVSSTAALITLDDRHPQAQTADAAQSQTVTGEVAALGPLDLRVGDRFTLPDGHPALVTFVPPEANGMQRARFRELAGRP